MSELKRLRILTKRLEAENRQLKDLIREQWQTAVTAFDLDVVEDGTEDGPPEAPRRGCRITPRHIERAQTLFDYGYSRETAAAMIGCSRSGIWSAGRRLNPPPL